MAAATAVSAAALLADVGAPTRLARERCLVRLRSALVLPGVRAACQSSLIAAWAADAATRTAAATATTTSTALEGDGGGGGAGGGEGESPSAAGAGGAGGGAVGWERACGLLRAATEVLAPAGRGERGGGRGQHADDAEFEAAVMDAAVEGIRHEEVRVRQVCAGRGDRNEGGGEEGEGRADGWAVQVCLCVPGTLRVCSFLFCRCGYSPRTCVR